MDTSLLVQGNIVDVRVTSANASSGNFNNDSRLPGYGQPCNLPISEFNPATATVTPDVALADCLVHDPSLLK